MKLYHKTHEEIYSERYFNAKNMTTELSQDIAAGDKLIHTKDWGSFKVRKNGKIRLQIGNEVVRVTRYIEKGIK